MTWSGATASAVGGYISYAVAWMKMTTLLQLPNGFAKGLIAKTPCPWHCNRLRKVTTFVVNDWNAFKIANKRHCWRNENCEDEVVMPS